MQNQEFFMNRCLELATKGLENVSPNPMVGSVIVHENKIIGEGYHKEFGKEHAEVNAIASVKNKSLLKYSTLYVNLEPCAHFGKTPPCSNLIIEHKIPKVVIGCVDTFSDVNGKGILKMEKAGIEINIGVLEKESQELNKRFFTFHEKKRPYIILKWAESKDGFIAPKNQIAPFWMTSSDSKKLVHQFRAEEDAILIGRVTVEKDNPSLTVREIRGENPIRIVIDKDLKLSKKLIIFNNEAKTIIFNTQITKKLNSNYYIKINYRNMINNILHELYKQNIQSLIIEGGAKTLQSFIDQKLWDEARIFTANKTLIEGVKSPRIEGEIIYETTIDKDQLEIVKNV
jgi:diaminohydroxyphosphoribosylaminopyrimidine deaminase/5-amino-6-(5-phosphoribosylamino)uracil reductase